MSQELICSVEQGIARMMINRPDARNAMTGPVIQEMLAFCRRIENDPDVRCLSITGAGEHFMAGGDVKSFMQVIDQPVEQLRANFEQRSLDAAPLWVILERMAKPVVCSVRGFCAGAALSFVAGSNSSWRTLGWDSLPTRRRLITCRGLWASRLPNSSGFSATASMPRKRCGSVW